MTCPVCGGPLTQGAGFSVCLKCGHHVRGEPPTQLPATSGPVLALVDRLPHAIALPVAEYVDAPTGYERLHRLTDAAELLTRFCVAIVLADLLDSNSERRFPDAVEAALVERLERPTFGAWAGLLETSVRALPKRDRRLQCIVPNLPVFVLDTLLPMLGGNQTPPEAGIIALRNVLAHRGRLAEADERQFIEAYVPRFEHMITQAAFFADVQVVGSPAPGRAFLLHGVPAAGASFPVFDIATLPVGVAPPEPDRLLLIAGGRAIDLFPLHAYGDVFHYVDKTREEIRATGGANTDPRANFAMIPEASPAPLLYFRRGAKEYLEYTSLSPQTAHSQEGFVALERFRQMFQLEQWRRNQAAWQARREFDFSEWRTEWLELFVGRNDQVRQVAKWAHETRSGLCWISGHPGVGKSAFMADLAERFFTDDEHYCKIVHFFRGADLRGNQMKFLENALTSMWASFGEAEKLEADPQKRLKQFELRLAHISRAQAELPAPQQRRIVFLLDGLDEVIPQDREFPDLIIENQRPGVLWICAGRNVSELGKCFRAHHAHEPFGEDGLPPLRDGDLREILDKECGRQIYQLIARDRPDTPPNGNSNPFLDALVERSQGLPLYLRLVVQDIREGRLSFKEGDEKKLPLGLASYYERVLERLQISDVAAVLTPVFCLLACAKSPLTLETLLELMKDDRLIREGGESLLRHVLDFGHLLLKRVVITEPRNVGEEGEPHIAPAYVLYHESFRDHLLATDTVKYAVRAAHTSVRQFTIQYFVHKDNLFAYRYALRFGPSHLIDGSAHSFLEAMLLDIRFIEQKCLAHMTYELMDDFDRAEILLSARSIHDSREFWSPRAAFLSSHPHCAASELASEASAAAVPDECVAAAKRMLSLSHSLWLEKVCGPETIGSWLPRPTVAVGTSSDGSLVMTGDDKGRVLIWENPGWRLRAVHSFPGSHSGASVPMLLHILPDSQHYVFVPSYNEMRIVSLRSGATVHEFGNLWDADMAYVTGDTLLVVNRTGGELWSLASLPPRRVDVDVEPNQLPYWVGESGYGVSRDQYLWDLRTVERKGRMNLASVPSQYEWREHLFHSITPYSLLSAKEAIHVGDTITFHELSSGSVTSRFELAIPHRKPYGYRTGARVVVAQTRQVVIVWSRVDGKAVQIISVHNNVSRLITFDLFVVGVFLSADESTVFVSLADDTLTFQARRHELKIYSTETMDERSGPPALPAATDTMISDDGVYGLVDKRELTVLDSNQIIARFEQADTTWTNPPGGEPFLGFYKGSGSVVSYSSRGTQRELFTAKSTPSSVKVSADARRWAVVFGSHTGSSAIVVKDGKKKHYVVDDSFGDGISANLSSNGKWLGVVVNHHSSIGLNSGHCLWVVNNETDTISKSDAAIVDWITFVKVVESHGCIVLGFDSGIVQRRSLATLEVQWEAQLHTGHIRKVAVAEDGQSLASLGGDNRLVLSDVRSGAVLTAKPFGFLAADMQLRRHGELVLVGPGGGLYIYRLNRSNEFAHDRAPS